MSRAPSTMPTAQQVEAASTRVDELRAKHPDATAIQVGPGGVRVEFGGAVDKPDASSQPSSREDMAWRGEPFEA